MTTESPTPNRTLSRRLVIAVAAILVAGGALLFATTREQGATAHPTGHDHTTIGLASSSGADHVHDFAADRPETERFLEYERSIELTPEQEAIRIEALEALPAPCCKQFSAATCCCKCNMTRATWGLSKHLIVNEEADAATVREAVAEWHHAINPDGFSGDACFTGGCARSFADNGCGGMVDGELVF